MAVSDEWKTMGDFAPGLDTNRLPSTAALDGRTMILASDDGFRVVNHYDGDRLGPVTKVTGGMCGVAFGQG